MTKLTTRLWIGVIILGACATYGTIAQRSDGDLIAAVVSRDAIINSWVGCFPPDHAYISYRYSVQNSPQLNIVSGIDSRHIAILQSELKLDVIRNKIVSTKPAVVTVVTIDKITFANNVIDSVTYHEASRQLTDVEVRALIRAGGSFDDAGIVLPAVPAVERFRDVLKMH